MLIESEEVYLFPTSPMFKPCGVCGCAGTIVVIGALNWGLIGLGGFLGSNWNAINLIFGRWPHVEWAIYILVGIAGILKIFSGKCGACKTA